MLSTVRGSTIRAFARVTTRNTLHSKKSLSNLSGFTTFDWKNQSHSNDRQTKSFSSYRTFATVAATETENLDDVIFQSLRKLDKDTVSKIAMDLKRIDKNKDGRLEADELMELFRLYSNEFTEEEALEFRELFYAGKAGGTVGFMDFISALDGIAAKNKSDHPILDGNCSTEYIYRKTHTKYTDDELNIELTHRTPETSMDKLAYNTAKFFRFCFDTATGWNGEITQEKILNRAIFLETIAGVPGFVAAIARHFKSLRTMERDGGLLHLFLEEANNERMHLLSFISMKDPGFFFRAAVVVSQFGFGGAFMATYALHPKLCHRFVGYIEEEACHTYTKIIAAIEEAPEGSELAEWKTKGAPKIAIGYWELGEEGTILDLMYAVRADEAEHRDVNHVACELALKQTNPFNDPEMKISIMLRRYIQEIMQKQ